MRSRAFPNPRLSIVVSLLSVASVLVMARELGAQGIDSSLRIKAGEWRYSARIEDGLRRIDLGTRTVTVTPFTTSRIELWLVVMSMLVEGQPLVDSVVMRRGSLAPVSRHSKGPGVETRLTVRDGTARGLLSWDSTVTPVNIAVPGKSFLNYYSLRAFIQELPLSADWLEAAYVLELAPYPHFAGLGLQVLGEEQVTVPAGVYDCWQLRVWGVEGPTTIDERYWISKDGHHVVRTREPIGSDRAIMQLDLVAFTPHP